MPHRVARIAEADLFVTFLAIAQDRYIVIKSLTTSEVLGRHPR